MRLINVRTGQLELFHDKIPPYAILSHTWGEDEIIFDDIKGGPVTKQGPSRFKFDGCCREAEKHGLEYAWIDTCCINKSDSTELGESINSMFRWYQDAAVCYAFIADAVSMDDASFSSSRWFSRGWTLQELLAPTNLVFYNQSWRFLCSKGQILSRLEEITGIPQRFLGQPPKDSKDPPAPGAPGAPLHEASVAQRMSWASKRETTKKEDMAYCLIGIFGLTSGTVNTVYGVGGEAAFQQLQMAIMKESPDDSILAWGLNTRLQKHEPQNLFGSVLASSPADFLGSGGIISGHRGNHPRTIKNLGSVDFTVELCLPFWWSSCSTQVFGALKCRPKGNVGTFVGIPLCQASPGEPSNGYLRPAGHEAIVFRGEYPTTAPKRNVIALTRQPAPPGQGPPYQHHQFGFRIPEPSQIVDVWPATRWDRKNSYIITGVDPGFPLRTWLRLNYSDAQLRDFVALLESEVKDSKPVTRCYLMIASRQTTLQTIARKTRRIASHMFGKQSASNSSFNLHLELVEESLESLQILTLKLTSLREPLQNTVDITNEIALIHRQQSLLRYLKEAHGILPQIETINSSIETKKKEVNDQKTRLAVVEKELLRLQNEQRNLALGVSLGSREIDQLNTKHQNLQARHDYIHDQIAPPDFSPEFSQESTRRWHHTMIDEISLMLPETKSAEILKMADKTQRVFMQAIECGHKPIVKVLIDRAASLDFTTSQGDGVLIWTTRTTGSLTIIKWLLGRNVNVDQANLTNGLTSLSWAAFNGQYGLAEILLDHGASINHKDSLGITPAAYAARANQWRMLDLLLNRGADIETRGSDGLTPLARAAVSGATDAARLLVQRKAQIHSSGQEGWTVLHRAVVWSRIDIVKILLDYGADIEASGIPDRSPLMEACSKSLDDIVQLLLDRGADVEAKGNNNTCTPLVLAAGSKSVKIVQSLLERGATTTGVNKHGLSPLAIAAHNGTIDVAHALLAKGANIESADKNGKTPLIWAVLKGHRRTAKWLMERRANVNHRDNVNGFPLSYATSTNRSDIICDLLRHGADVNTLYSNGATVLHTAIQRGHKEAVQTLLNNGASIVGSSKIFLLPLAYAKTFPGDHANIADIIQILKVAEQKWAESNRRNIQNSGAIPQ